MEEGCGVFEGEIHIHNGIIAHVGESIENENKDIIFDKEIDAGKNLVMPGFKNAHTHSAMTRLRSFADDLPLQRWLTENIFPAEKRWIRDYVKPFCTLAIMEYLSSGITACLDMYLYPEIMAEAAAEADFRLVLCGELNDFTSSLDRLKEDNLRYNSGNPLISHRLGFHAEYTTSRKLICGVAELADSLKQPVCTHLSETSKEVNDCIERNGVTPTEYLADIGVFNHGGVAFHSCHLSEKDMQLYREKRIYAVTNPSSNLKLASGIPPLTRLSELGVDCAVGTDGAASNNSLDMFKEMFLVAGLQKLAEGSASAMPAVEVLKMATVNGSRAMGLSGCATLTSGQSADLIIIDLDRPNMRPLNNIPNNLVYSASKENVILTMVNGKILYNDGKFNIGVEPSDVYKEVDRLSDLMR